MACALAQHPHQKLISVLAWLTSGVESVHRLDEDHVFGELRWRGCVEVQLESILGTAYLVPIIFGFDQSFDALVTVSMAAHGQQPWGVGIGVLNFADGTFELFHNNLLKRVNYNITNLSMLIDVYYHYLTSRPSF